MKFAICEDDELDKKMLVKTLAELQGWDIYYDLYTNGDDLLESYHFQNNEYDLYILDIEMPGMDGIQLARKIREKNDSALFMFVTNHSKYQIEALNLITLGYIIKPATKENVESALTIARPFIQEKDNRIFIVSNKMRRSVKITEILYICTAARIKSVVTVNEKIDTYMSTKEIMNLLPDDLFVQTHKSFIVNMRKIDSVETEFVHLTDGERIEISKRQRKKFNDKFMNFLEGAV